MPRRRSELRGGGESYAGQHRPLQLKPVDGIEAQGTGGAVGEVNWTETRRWGRIWKRGDGGDDGVAAVYLKGQGTRGQGERGGVGGPPP